MKTETSVTDLLRGFSDYINRVVYRGESFDRERGRIALGNLRDFARVPGLPIENWSA